MYTENASRTEQWNAKQDIKPNFADKSDLRDATRWSKLKLIKVKLS